MLEQIEKVSQRINCHKEVEDQIRALSWEGLVERMNEIIKAIVDK